MLADMSEMWGIIAFVVFCFVGLCLFLFVGCVYVLLVCCLITCFGCLGLDLTRFNLPGGVVKRRKSQSYHRGVEDFDIW